MSIRLALDPDVLLLTDGGLETVLLFRDGIELPAFAAFPLLSDADGVARLERYYREFLDVAADAGAGFVLETPTWRAGPDWAAELGYSVDDLRRVADASVALGRGLLDGWSGGGPAWVSGCLGPRGETYEPDEAMSAAQAADYHAIQVAQLAAAGADVVTAFTLGYPEEAVGVVTAAAALDIPSVVGFTVEPDGRLPSGTPLEEAVQQVDEATGAAASWFMVNCAHPEHVLAGLPAGSAAADDGPLSRIRAYRPNASRLSHAALDVVETLDDGDPAELADGVRAVRCRLPAVQVVGGCCGTDVRHVRAMAQTRDPARAETRTALTRRRGGSRCRPLQRKVEGRDLHRQACLQRPVGGDPHGDAAEPVAVARPAPEGIGRLRGAEHVLEETRVPAAVRTASVRDRDLACLLPVALQQ